MLKKALAGILGLALAVTLTVPATEVSAAEFAAEATYPDEVFEEDILLSEEEEIYIEEESIGDSFTGEGVLSGEDVFSAGDAAFSGGDDPFTDTEDTSTEKTLEVTEGEDITAKLNAALLEMKDKATDEKMCKVIIPPGNYTITGTICTYSNIHLYAVGAVITKMSPKKELMLRLGNTLESAGGYDGYRNVIIEGGTWDANYETVPNKEENGGFVDFRLGHATNVTVKDVTFLNNLKSHFLEFGGVKKALVTGCTFRGYWEPYEGGGQECIQIDACKERIYPDYLPYDGAVCEDIVIEGNTFENVFAGVGSHSMMFDKPYKNIIIRGNTFTNITKRAIWCLNYVDSIVENNVMTNVGGGVYIRTVYSGNTSFVEGQMPTAQGNQYPSNITVANNEISVNEARQIDGTMWDGFGVSILGDKCQGAATGVPDGNYVLRNVTVKNNKITGYGHGVRLTLADKCKVTDNRIDLTPSEVFNNIGVYIGAGNANTITGNSIKGAKTNGIYLYKSTSFINLPCVDNVLSKNTVTACGTGGISLGKSTANTKLEKNTVKEVLGDGITVNQNQTAYVSGNTVTGCQGSGIFVSSGKKVTVTGNTTSGNKVDGIKSEGGHSDFVVKKNKTSKNSGAGMCIGGGKGAVITENEVTSNTNNGIAIRDAKDVAITKNTVKNNKGYAVIGTNSAVKTFSGNKLTGNDHTNTIWSNNTSYPYSVKSKRK